MIIEHDQLITEIRQLATRAHSDTLAQDGQTRLHLKMDTEDDTDERERRVLSMSSIDVVGVCDCISPVVINETLSTFSSSSFIASFSFLSFLNKRSPESDKRKSTSKHRHARRVNKVGEGRCCQYQN